MTAPTGYNTLNVRQQGGALDYIGGTLEIGPGGTLQIDAGGIVNGLTAGTAWFCDSVNGNDANSGKAWSSAFKTIAAAVAAAAAGDAIYVKGSFSEAVVVALAGLSIVGIGSGPHQATWTAAADAVCLTLQASDCLVRNIRFQPPAYAAGTPAAIVLSNAPYARIVGNRFQGKQGSMYAIFCALDAAHSSDNVLIQGNEFIYLNNVTTVYGSAIESTAVDGGFSCSSWQIVDNLFDAPVEGININARGCLIAPTTSATRASWPPAPWAP